MHSISKFIFASIIGMAIIGIISLLMTNPADLLKQILFIGVMVAVVIFIMKRFSGNNRYRNAVKQSKKRHRERFTRPSHLKVIQSKSMSRRGTLKRLAQKDNHHLTVIDGKKKRRRKRVFF